MIAAEQRDRAPGTEFVEAPERILIASEGRAIPSSVIARALELARPRRASVRVLTIARIHGTSFGFPNPGLLPTKHEWNEQRESVRKTVARLQRKGIEANGHVLGTRKSTKSICREAELAGADVIVMAADPDRNRLIGDMMWSQEPQRVRRRSKLPVILVRDGG
ncbi:MAG: universal stress protein [Solirubrobacteraceae bacterium]